MPLVELCARPNARATARQDVCEATATWSSSWDHVRVFLVVVFIFEH